MKVKDIMTHQVECVLASGSLADAARKMKEQDIGVLPVVDNGEPVGIVTDRDIVLRGVADDRDPKVTPVSDVMSREVVSCQPDCEVDKAAHTMEEKGVRRLLVRDGDKLVGMLSVGDVAGKKDELAGHVLSSLRTAGSTR